MNWQDEIFQEKSLWDVYIKAYGVTGSSANTWTVIAVTALLLSTIIADLYFDIDQLTQTTFIVTVRLWAEAGIAFATSILGFLLAGFSIFATMTRNELFVALAHLPHKKGNISRLKFVFFNFLIVFISYLVFLALCLSVALLLGEDTPLTHLIGCLTEGRPWIQYALGATAWVIIGSLFSAVFLMLKSFIWNLYQSILLAIATKAELEKQRSCVTSPQFSIATAPRPTPYATSTT